MFYQCGNCRHYLQQSELAGICTNCECRYFGDHVGASESCNKWCQEDEKHKLRPPTKAESLCSRCFHNNACSSVLKEHLLIEELLCGMNPVCKDFAEIVRCKDCKHHKILSDYRTKTLPVCGRKNLNVEMHENDFCSRGERKVENEE